MADIKKTSYLTAANSIFIEELYQKYLVNPASVDESWQQFFVSSDANSYQPAWSRYDSQVIGAGVVDAPKKVANDISFSEGSAALDSIRALRMVRAYRSNGHLMANLDPLGLMNRPFAEELNPAKYGFSEQDLSREVITKDFLIQEKATVGEIISLMQDTYCRNIGVEFTYMESEEQRDWLIYQLEPYRGRPNYSKEQKSKIFRDLVETEHFEQFLHVKFPGAKRFSVEGGDALIPALEVIIETAANNEVEEIIIGMPHRGRLNVLTKIMGKSYTSMLSEFQGNLAHPEFLKISGDVKYHLGTSSDRLVGGKKIHLSLTANPSHLEAVNPVVAGKIRAKQDMIGDKDRKKVMGILMHGDASFSGQGIVPESLMLADLEGYRTGGIVHVIVNNQIGFTTNPDCGHSSPYPSDVAKIIQAPIFHVNGDDPEAVAYVAKIASEFRHKFNKDVVIDIFCYRRYGHNEGDEPMFTQPQMYKKIATHPTIANLYAAQLAGENSLSKEESDKIITNFRAFLDKSLEASKSYKPNKAEWLEGKWAGLEKSEFENSPKTGVDIKKLKEIGLKLAEKPAEFNLNSKIIRQLEAKIEMMKSGEGLDWAMGEALAYGSLLVEGVGVRLSGQDCKRGTFSHRQSVFFDQENGREYTPLNHLAKEQGYYEVINSNLSEFGVLGFEHGYSLVNPSHLNVWEAQFGDFSNGAQIIIDQFIASSETKWLRMSGLVMLLPHGYEGQGPEHSSARLERYLQLCGEDNMQVANCTTPASFFHIIRRQLARNYRKPLIIMTPKSLLRHKLAVSSIKEFDKGTAFTPVIGEMDKIAKTRKVLICSGKIYYDLYEEREKKGIKDIAILRLEQYYPFPEKELKEELKKYKDAEIIWVQEESENMGAWTFLDRKLEKILAEIGAKYPRPKNVSRETSASPAAGYLKIHNKEQVELVGRALG